MSSEGERWERTIEGLVEGEEYVFTMTDGSAFVGTFLFAGAVFGDCQALLMSDGTRLMWHAVYDYRLSR